MEVLINDPAPVANIEPVKRWIIMSMQRTGSDSIKSIKYLCLQAVSWHRRLEIKHKDLRLVTLTHKVLQPDLCPFQQCPFSSMFSDDYFKNVNTNVKVGMSQCVSGLLSFTERHFPNSKHISKILLL